MSTDWTADVQAFREKFALEIPESPGFPSQESRSLLQRLDWEEEAEIDLADSLNDLPEFAKECIDRLYTGIGRLIAHGIDPRPIWDAVHAANMAKDGGARRADGKILKPPGWAPPDVAGLIERQPSLTHPPARADATSEEKADAWLIRNKRKPLFVPQISNFSWYEQESFAEEFDEPPEPDEIPRIVMRRFKSNVVAEIASYSTKSAAFDELRQALIACFEAGEDVPDCPQPETVS